MIGHALLSIFVVIALAQGQLFSTKPPPFFQLEQLLKIKQVTENAYPQSTFKSALPKNESLDYRLPRTVIPEAYNLTMQVPLEGNFGFRGFVEINATVVNTTSEISLHQKDLTIREYRVYAGGKLKVNSTRYNNVTHIYTLVMEEPLEEGTRVLIVLKFKGMLSEDVKGFYRSSYYDNEGNRRWLATTQFEPVYARQAFPCFDEPGFKATFKVHIRRPKNFTALSNMPKISTVEYSDSALDTFEETPRMSSYILAMVISDFSVFTANSSKVHIWTKDSITRYGKFPLAFGTKVLEAFEELFNFSNPVPKTDMVAVPDFYALAMENWGLITYREHLLTFDENENSDEQQQDIATVIAHEFAHMWFGNLITPEWWEFTWLNEGFSNYFQHIGTFMIEPSWKSNARYFADIRNALTYDSFGTAPSISHPCQSPEEIVDIFGPVTYSKGGSIVRMMAESFGPKVFYGGLREYIDKNQFGNVQSDSIWEALQSQVEIYMPQLETPVKTLMSNWINKPGHPMLNVYIEKDQIHINQTQFLLTKQYAKNDNSSIDDKWYVPITFASQENPNFTIAETTLWMKENLTIQMANASKQWVVLNRLGAGFYRVNYDLQSWYRIIRTLNSKNFADIHEYNRIALMSDLFDMARAGEVDYDLVFDALEYIPRETSYLVMRSVLEDLQYLVQKFSGREEEELLRTHIMNLIKDIYKQLGFFDSAKDSKYTTLLRAELNALACKLNHPKCRSSALKSFAKWRKNPAKRITANQRPIVYCYAIRDGTSEDWEFLHQQYLKTRNSHDRHIILSSLGCTQNYTLIEKTLIKTMSNYDVTYQIKKEDGMVLFDQIASDGFTGAQHMLQFLAKHHEKVMKYIKSEKALSELLFSAASSFTTQERIDNFQKYVDENIVIYKPIMSDLETIKQYFTYQLQSFSKRSVSIINWLYKMYPHD